MTSPEQPIPPGAPGAGEPTVPVTTLRGPAVSVDGRRAARAALVVVLVALAVLTAALFVAAAGKDSALIRLQHHGVPVEVTVTSCLGNLGGSGSNAASYTCRGTFTLDGRAHTEVIAGTTSFHRTGATLAAVTDPSDPSDLATAATVATTHRSASVYAVPTVLAVVLVLAVAVALWRLRHARSTQPRP